MCGGGGDEPEQTPEERELGRIAVERWNDYQVRFTPVENQYIEDVQMNETDVNSAVGKTATSVQQSFGGAEDALRGNLFAQGMGINGSQYVDAMDGLGQDRGLSMGTGKNETELAVDNAHLQGLQSVVQMGQGQSMEAFQGLSSVAGNATNDAINRANMSFQNRQAGLHLAGTVAGAGAHYAMNATPSVNMQGQDTPLYNNPAYVKRF